MIGSKRKYSPFFCAVCTADIYDPIPKQAPLGRLGAMVVVCDGCYIAVKQEQNPPSKPYRGRK